MGCAPADGDYQALASALADVGCRMGNLCLPPHQAATTDAERRQHQMGLTTQTASATRSNAPASETMGLYT
ncbi:hypothetical protein PsYK624_165740 [Phanerochaete sordida]|uniref:Uncharacterized protein n=1 Tax=Phanerochaete sordida TaxID=48140 RepID=A0A9P3GTD6_9APHY|nr:hypothetical protein PsYK624_165740 [Phanerochaete sordida]